MTSLLARLLPDRTPAADGKEYRKLKRKLDNHLLPKKNKHFARCTFSKEQQLTSEKLWLKQSGEYFTLNVGTVL